MIKESGKAVDIVAGGLHMGGSNAEVVKAPEMWFEAECFGSDGRHWRDGPNKNVVLNEGKGQVLNRAFGFGTASTFGMFAALYSATSASNSVWSNVSASQLGGYSAEMPRMTFGSGATAGSTSGSVAYTFTAGPGTVSGVMLLWHTTNTCSTNAATAGIKAYNMGQFANSRQVLNGDTLNVTATLSFA